MEINIRELNRMIFISTTLVIIAYRIGAKLTKMDR